ncbi:exodeoxyribonuclease VII small subunit [Alkaliphilus serpentinus]|uniref:Exodeoxyribonuclease 7 small subunit n=1 Tax=Alkaliphilus serpentinus TaxID=1482731 RepID=A0A833HN58_9FIRM|nr:exodeoxyribonuclease VII small subunit [Alkaliphilus serpentinus]KAB3527567.1 exodeoxyribonuclease VII small subunit [Alkaliphilus serpentinus]
MKKENFEEAFKKLEEIIDQLENKELSLDESLKLFQEGTKLYQQCHSKLDEAEKRISKILDDNGSIKMVPFETEEE